uniref:U25-Sparatoxin-Hju1f_1 n=1 Tax=Heteropoda jugulans TaxID=1358901 RepID=A0A4Q8K9G9_9ARAC
MKFAFSVVLMVITLLVVVSAEAPEVENDVSDILERGRRTCAKENESCDVLEMLTKDVHVNATCLSSNDK